MCTAAVYTTKDHYFGRSLDLEYSYAEEVTVTPRNYEFRFRHLETMPSHYAIIGMATVSEDYPLYYEATNEAGLSIGGLNFVGNAVYKPFQDGVYNVAPFEFIPWILGQCSKVSEAKKLISRMNMVNTQFSEKFPLAELHWIIADRDEVITVEAVADGIRVYDNPAGVLTNNPTFDHQLFNLNNYLTLSRDIPANTFSDRLDLRPYSKGMGMLGMPGDLSSMSRFVRAAFTRLNSVSGDSESESLSQFFHILGSVAQARGLVDLGNDEYEISIYSSCCNTDKGIYYYITYENSQISGVDMHNEDLDSCELITYPLIIGQQIRMQN